MAEVAVVEQSREPVAAVLELGAGERAGPASPRSPRSQLATLSWLADPRPRPLGEHLHATVEELREAARRW